MTEDMTIDYESFRAEIQTNFPPLREDQISKWFKLYNILEQCKRLDSTSDLNAIASESSKVLVDNFLDAIARAENVLAQRRYNIIFFGPTSAGKSTLINALIGRNILPTGMVDAITGTIVSIEQVADNEPENLQLVYCTRTELEERIHLICGDKYANITPFRLNALDEAKSLQAIHTFLQSELAKSKSSELAKSQSENTENPINRTKYLMILIDYVDTYSANRAFYRNETPNDKVIEFFDQSTLEAAQQYLRETPYPDKNPPKDFVRQIRLIKEAQFKIKAGSADQNILLNGFLTLIDVPGIGASTPIHELITLEKLNEDSIIVLLMNTRRLPDEQTDNAFAWVKTHYLGKLDAQDRSETAASLFLVVNNNENGYKYISNPAPIPDRVRELSKLYISEDYWETYAARNPKRPGTPYFFVMPLPALYIQDPEGAPETKKAAMELLTSALSDGRTREENLLSNKGRNFILDITEINALRSSLIQYASTERIDNVLRQASIWLRHAIRPMRVQCERTLVGSYKLKLPFADHETTQENFIDDLLTKREYEHINHVQKVLLEFSKGAEHKFEQYLTNTITSIQDSIRQGVADKLPDIINAESGEVDDIPWGRSGRETRPNRVILRVQIEIHEILYANASLIAEQLHEILKDYLEKNRVDEYLQSTTYAQHYVYENLANGAVLSDNPRNLTWVYEKAIEKVGQDYYHGCQQAVIYEFMRSRRWTLAERLEQRIKTGPTLAMQTGKAEILESLINTEVEALAAEFFKSEELITGLRQLFRFNLENLNKDLTYIIKQIIRFHKKANQQPDEVFIKAIIQIEHEELGNLPILVWLWNQLAELETQLAAL
jgi:hypothetical protein